MVCGQRDDCAVGMHPVLLQFGGVHADWKARLRIRQSITQLRPDSFDAGGVDGLVAFDLHNGNASCADGRQHITLEPFAQRIFNPCGYKAFETRGFRTGVKCRHGRKGVCYHRIFLKADGQKHGCAGGDDHQEEECDQPGLAKR